MLEQSIEFLLWLHPDYGDSTTQLLVLKDSKGWLIGESDAITLHCQFGFDTTG